MDFLRKLKATFSPRQANDGAKLGQRFVDAARRFNQAHDIALPMSEHADESARGEHSSYFEAELAAHTTAIERLSAEFDTLTVSFDALAADRELYGASAPLFALLASMFNEQTYGYEQGAGQALLRAFEIQLAAAKAEVDAFIGDRGAPHELLVATSKGNSLESYEIAKQSGLRLEQAARSAEIRAAELCEGSQAAKDRADAIALAFGDHEL